MSNKGKDKKTTKTEISYGNAAIDIEVTKLNNLCSHYKESSDVYYAKMKHKTVLMYILLALISLIWYQSVGFTDVLDMVAEGIQQATNINIEKRKHLIYSAELLCFLILFVKFCLLEISIRAKEIYLLDIENVISKHYSDNRAYKRETSLHLFQEKTEYSLFIYSSLELAIKIIAAALSVFIIWDSFNFEHTTAHAGMNIGFCVIITAVGVLYLRKIIDLHELLREKLGKRQTKN